MPIIEVPNETAPLSQGDILAKIRLFCTGQPWNGDGGTPDGVLAKECLVLSRQCILEHGLAAVVAAVEKYPVNVPRDVETFDDVLRFLTGLRDGHRTPNLFYLGQLPDREGRYCCRFDAVFTIQLSEDAEKRRKFVTEHRIATLGEDFIRDLHIRLFNAYASLGFNDTGWLSDDDLKWLMAAGSATVSKIEQRIRTAEGEQARTRASGQTPARKTQQALDKGVKDKSRVEPLLQPFVEEARRRGLDTA